MKKKIVLLLFSIAILSACGTVNLPKPQSNIGLIDYSGLTQKGIFVTESNSVNFDYEAIASVYIEEIGGWVRKDGKPDSDDPKSDYYINSSARKKTYEKPNLQEVFKKLVEQLKEQKANGIINLRISFATETIVPGQVYADKIIISGMAIRK